MDLVVCSVEVSDSRKEDILVPNSFSLDFSAEM